MQIMCNASSAYHMQHVVCHMVQRDSSATKFDKVDVTLILALFFIGGNHLTDEGEEETGENP